MDDLREEIKKRINNLSRIIKKEDNNILLKAFACKGIELNAKILKELDELEERIEDLESSSHEMWNDLT